MGRRGNSDPGSNFTPLGPRRFSGCRSRSRSASANRCHVQVRPRSTRHGASLEQESPVTSRDASP
eukprot:3532036-Karenia_brevis.AAC.1